MIELKSVTRFFPARSRRPVEALVDVDLHVDAGEVVAVVGPSGSGKSTLLFTAGAMQAPTRGHVMVEGRDVYRLGATDRATLRRRCIGWVFQTFNLVPYLDCRENVALPAVLDGSPRPQASERAEMLLRRVGLEHRLAHRPSELSVGERQRVAIARALVNRPPVLLADEPTGNLDRETGTSIVDLLLELNGEGLTVLLVTHDPAVAARAHRQVVLRAGRIQGSDLPAESAA